MHWAHRVAARFPDGQLYVNLRGFDPGGAAMEPSEAIHGFLDAFGVPATRIPAAVESQASLYRSVLASKRVLIVVDNARDEEQVRPLLPGAPGCFVVVTSRHQLTGLVATEGAQPLTLDLPSAAEAQEMLTRRLDSRRVAAEPDAVADIVACCARLPLALAVASARAATYPNMRMSELAVQLHDTAAALDPFQGHDAASDVRVVFSWSYQTLSEGAARLFRWLGLAPGPDIALPAAVSLLGLPAHDVRPLLAELTHVHLLTEPSVGRYAFHDLLRAYAIEQALQHDSDQERSAALQRVLDHYLHTAWAATIALSQHRYPIKLTPAQSRVETVPMADNDRAMAWFAAEHPVLIAAVAQDPSGLSWRPWQLAWTLSTFLDRRGHWHDSTAVHDVALTVATRVGDLEGQGNAHRLLGAVDIKLGRLDAGDAHQEQAFRIFEEIGDHIGLAHTLISRCWTAHKQGNHKEALRLAQQAVLPYQLAGHRTGQAHALNSVGFCHAQLEEYEKAQVYCERALGLFEEMDNHAGLGCTSDSLGYIYFAVGDVVRGVECYQHAIASYRKIGDLYNEADTFVNLGDAHEVHGNLDSARDAWHRAATILDGLDHPAAAEVRAKLTAVIVG